jgi:hypothetical protein
MSPTLQSFGLSQAAWTSYKTTNDREGAARWRRALRQEDLDAGAYAGVLLPRIWMERRSTLPVLR